MKISFMIPAHNEENYIASCIDSIRANAGGSMNEIIVIDNASSDRTAEIARSKGARVVDEPRKGTGFARQRGLKEAGGDFLAYLDADTRLPVGWVAKAERIFQTQPGVVCISGPYRYYDGTPFRKAVMNALWYLSAPIPYRIVGYMVLGGNCIARKSALDAAGGFDTEIEFYGDDTDLARRLSSQGKVLFRMDFFMYSSSRRMAAEGLVRTNIRYALNFIWPVLFHRPFTKKYSNVSSQTDV